MNDEMAQDMAEWLNIHSPRTLSHTMANTRTDRRIHFIVMEDLEDGRCWAAAYQEHEERMRPMFASPILEED